MDRPALEILLVEDNPMDIDILREALVEVQPDTGACHLAAVQNSASAIAYLQGRAAVGGETLPDIVLLDINMPVENGIETLKKIKSDPALKHVPVLMLTTSNRREDIVDSYAAGAASYFLKPLKYSDLLDLLKSILIYWTSVTRIERTPPSGRAGGAQGFTLIELLVVTVILAVVSVYATVRIGKTIDKSRKAAMLTYMVSEFRAGMRDYYLEHNAYPPGIGPTDPTVVLKAEGFITSTITEKSLDLGVTVNAVYYSGFPGGLLGGLGIASTSYWYAWCLLPPVSVGLDLPCVKVTESALEESSSLLIP